MEHPCADRLNDFLLGKLLEPEARAVEVHLEQCEPCCERLYELTQRPAEDQFVARLRQAPDVPPRSAAGGTDVDQVTLAVNRGAALARTVPPDRPNDATCRHRRLAGYEILEELGQGGMSVVYRARDPRLKRDVAIKVLRSEGRPGDCQPQRFRAEAEIIARLRHEGIVQIHEVGEADGQLYLVLELVEAGDLYRLTRHQPQPPRTAAAWVEALARTTAYAHEHGIIHRDLKPSNVLVARRLPGQDVPASALKIADFGLAKQLDADVRVTRSGLVMGTPGYMAPEQATGEAVGPPADVYALGAILYELLTARAPFQADSVLETLRRVREEEPLPPRRLQPQVPRDLQTICLKCLEKEPRRRYASALALADDLSRFLHGKSIQARPASARERAWKWCRRQPLSAALLAGIILTTVGGVLGILEQWRQAVLERQRAERSLQALRNEQDVKRQRGKKSAPFFLQDARRSGANRQLDYALAQVDAALEYDPELVEALLVKAQLLIVKGDWHSAAQDLDRYVGQQPQDAEALRLLELCRQSKAGNPAQPAAFAEVFLRQKQYGLAAQMEQDRDRLLAIYRQQIEAAWPGAGPELRVIDGKLHLNLEGRQVVTELTPLQGLPIQVLNLNRCPVRDLIPLAGMPLQDLSIAEVPVANLTPLAGLRLIRLQLGNSPVNDLRPLAGMPLEELHLHQCEHLRDLTPLREMPLRLLDLTLCSQVRDLTLLQGMPLRDLRLGWTEVSDLTPIRKLQLTKLELNRHAQQRDLLLLQGMPLRALDLGACGAILDVTPLEGMKLESLRLHPHVQRGMEVVRRMTTLKTINGERVAKFWMKHDQGKFPG